MALANNGPFLERVNPISVDYREPDNLRRRIAEAISVYGPIELAVFWIHADAQEGFRVIADEVSVFTQDAWRLFHVRGSAVHLHPDTPKVAPNCLYRQVILRFVLEGEGTRWLMHNEISGGVIEAIQNDCERAVVGTLEQWEKRPR